MVWRVVEELFTVVCIFLGVSWQWLCRTYLKFEV